MDYGKALRALREKLLITQTELAQKLGVSYASVNRWENEKCEPTMKAKRQIKALCLKNGIGGNEDVK